MQRLTLLCLLLACIRPANAGAVTDSAACRTALQALQTQEDRVVAARLKADGAALKPEQAHLQRRRHETALACLGGHADAPPPATVARPPVAVTMPPVSPAVPLPRSTAVIPSSVSVPARPEPPVFITGCDASGCWGSNGTHLPRTPGGVLAPQGPCAVRGTVLDCGGAR